MTNKIKTDPETAIVFCSASGNPNMPLGAFWVQFNVDYLPPGSGHLSAQYDLGPGPRTTLFEWRQVSQIIPSGTIGNSVESHIVCGNGVFTDGNFSGGDQVVANPDGRRNIHYLGATEIDASGNAMLVTSGLTQIYSRYTQVMFWNNTTQNLASGSMLILTPVPDELQ